MTSQPAMRRGRPVARGAAAVIGLCLLSWGGPDPAAPAPPSLTEPRVEDLRPGRFFHGPTRLRVPLLGVTFAVPHPWRARLPAGSQVVHLDSARRPGLGIVLLLSDVTVEEVRARLDEPLAFEEAYTLDPASPVRQEGARLSASYLHGDQVGRAVAVLGPSGQAIVYVMAGPDDHASHYDEVVSALADSTQFMGRNTMGLLKTWYERLQGRRLERVSNGEIKTWHLCSDGQFLYEFRRPGAPPKEAGFEESGLWRIDVRADRAVLVIQPRFGIPRALTLGRDEEGVTLNDAQFGLTLSNRCF